MKRQTECLGIESFYWQSEEELEFKPGQYLRWILPHERVDDRGASRFFSIASSPSEELIMNTTRFSAERSSSFKASLNRLQLGDKIEVRGPMGNFTLPDESDTELVLVAGGIGITPYRSMLKFMHDKAIARPIHLLYASRSSADLAFRSLLDELVLAHEWLKLTYVVEQPEASWASESGRLDAQRIVDLARGLESKLTYLSGPEPMVKALKDGLLDKGILEDTIKTDYFPGYAEI